MMNFRGVFVAVKRPGLEPDIPEGPSSPAVLTLMTAASKVRSAAVAERAPAKVPIRRRIALLVACLLTVFMSYRFGRTSTARTAFPPSVGRGLFDMVNNQYRPVLETRLDLKSEMPDRIAIHTIVARHQRNLPECEVVAARESGLVPHRRPASRDDAQKIRQILHP